MGANLPNLLSRFDLNGLPLKNRVVMAPLTRSRAGSEQLPNDLMAKYYRQRASAGLIISEGASISEQGIGWLHVPGIYTEEQATAWQKVTAALHTEGTPIFIQLWHCGRASHSSFHPGKLPVAPSAIAMNGEPIRTPTGKHSYETPRVLETEEISEVVAEYRRATRLAKQAGFDGVEVHSASGYLLDTFLQSRTNHRSDRYGGSLENRFRLLREVLEAVCSEWDSDRVGVRLSPNSTFNDMGSPDFRETFLYVAGELNAFDLAYLHLVDGLVLGFHELGEPISLAEARQVYRGTLMGNCGYTAETAERAIASGDADVISFGRPFISNPDLVERFENGWELTEPDDPSTWYSFGTEGYADYPTYPEIAAS